jgi:pilus assembly protein Flp/PilA
MGMKLVRNFKEFLRDESGQTTTEYILILAVIVTIFMQFKRKLSGILTKLFKGLDDATDSALEEMGDG